MKSINLIHEVKDFLAWFLPAIMAAVVKLAYESRSRKINWKRVASSLPIACFVGWLCDQLCTHYEINNLRGFVVALGALGSDSIMAYLFKNMSVILPRFAHKIFNIKSKNNDTDNN